MFDFFLIIHFMDPFIISALLHSSLAMNGSLNFHRSILGLQILITMFSHYVCHIDLVISIYVRAHDSAK